MNVEVTKMRKPYDPVSKALSEREAQREWEEFARAIQVKRPATQTFTKEALMLVHLTLGRKALQSN